MYLPIFYELIQKFLSYLQLIQLAEPFEDVVYGPIDIDLTENEGDPVRFEHSYTIKLMF